MNSRLRTLLKYTFACALLLYILHRVGTNDVMNSLKQVSPLNAFLALFFATLAQLASGYRMRFFFLRSGFAISPRYGIILFYVGAFYNFLLPGGIGGDAYKVMLARKRMNMPAMQGVRIMLADRASGLCVLLLLLYGLLGCENVQTLVPHARALLLLAAVVTLASYVVLGQWFLKQPPRAMLGSLPYSVVTQSLWVLALWVLWLSLADGRHLLEYITLYGAASIAGMIPVSVGGLGIREMTYFYGATFLHQFAGVPVDADKGVVLSLCMSAVLFLTSLPGLLWLEKAGTTETC